MLTEEERKKRKADYQRKRLSDPVLYERQLEQSRSWHRRNKDRKRRLTVERVYGLSVEDYEALLRRQDGLCACCGKPEEIMDKRTGKPRYLSVDHNHRSGQVRELVCFKCNVGLGWLESDWREIGEAYLSRHKGENADDNRY